MIPKFRAWYKNEMAEVRVLDWNNEVVDLFNPHIEIPLDEIELMQSTGLSDDLGEAIFEGDVILWTYWDEFEDEGVAKIVFDKGMFKLLDICTEKEVWNNLFDCIENCNVYLQGNIYEKPELLEVEG